MLFNCQQEKERKLCLYVSFETQHLANFQVRLIYFYWLRSQVLIFIVLVLFCLFYILFFLKIKWAWFFFFFYFSFLFFEVFWSVRSWPGIWELSFHSNFSFLRFSLCCFCCSWVDPSANWGYISQCGKGEWFFYWFFVFQNLW